MSSIRIGIIGGGSSGATACKACLEEGFDVVVYEKTDQTGGLWRYREDVVDGIGSVTKSTIINSSKEMSAFSDFPPPEEFPNYMHNTKMVKYLDLYGQRFGYERYVHYRHEVIKVEPNPDYDETGKWCITVKDMTNGRVFNDVVNGVMVCTGHHVQPHVPTFTDQDKFSGQVLHTHSYKRPDSFADKRVVVVGIGNSGVDACVDLSSVAEQVYLSTRRGAWIGQRIGPNGKPFDTFAIRRFASLLMTYLPYSLVCAAIESSLNSKFNHKEYGLQPEHRALSAHVTLNDALPNRILSGTVVVRPDIQRFTENGVVFEGDTTETLCDVVLLGTGYKMSFPFLSEILLPTDGNRVRLYKYVFSPALKHPKTLAFIALVQPLGAVFPIAELQSRWFAGLMANRRTLPDSHRMNEDIERKARFQKRFYSSQRHTIQVDWIPFMDELADEVGVKPNLWKYVFSDFQLWKALMFGPALPYQYRLEGPHHWSGARNAILTVDERISAPLRTRFTSSDKKVQLKCFSNITLLIFFIVIAFILNYLFF